MRPECAGKTIPFHARFAEDDTQSALAIGPLTVQRFFFFQYLGEVKVIDVIIKQV